MRPIIASRFLKKRLATSTDGEPIGVTSDTGADGSDCFTFGFVKMFAHENFKLSSLLSNYLIRTLGSTTAYKISDSRVPSNVSAARKTE